MNTDQSNMERREQNRRRNRIIDAHADQLVRREQSRIRNERLDAIAAERAAGVDAVMVRANTLTASLCQYTEYAYHARGCAYVFAIQDDGHAVVEAIARDGSTKWEARIDVDPAATVLGLIRDARQST